MKHTSNKISVAIADDTLLLLQMLSRGLEAEGDLHIMITAANGAELIEALDKATVLPHICLVDARMPVMDGFETINSIHNKWPDIKLLVLSDFDHPEYIDHMQLLGAHDYLNKKTTPELIARAIRDLTAGRKPKDGLFTEGPVRGESRRNQELISGLSAKELEFLKLCATSLNSEEIKKQMKVSKASGEGYRSSLFKKFNVNSRIKLKIIAERLGIIITDPGHKDQIL